MLEATQLAKTFAGPGGELDILRDVSFTLGAGQSLAIMGPSGTGKSTLLNILGTLDRPTSGEVRLDGHDPFALDAAGLAHFRNRRVGFVFQEHHLLPQCSVWENVLVPTLVTGTPDGADRADRLLKAVGLDQRIGHFPSELSGGERQRVAIARALINEPQLLLADEPTGNLDEDTAGGVLDLMLSLHAERRQVLIVVTHSEAIAARLDATARLAHGRLSIDENGKRR